MKILKFLPNSCKKGKKKTSSFKESIEKKSEFKLQKNLKNFHAP